MSGVRAQLWICGWKFMGRRPGILALRTVARGGIYIAGGIAVKVLPKLKNGKFAAAVKHKEKLENFFRRFPSTWC